MKTKKERTIKACRKTAEKYRNPWGRLFFLIADCALCDIHEFDSDCRGCPLANENGSEGCSDFKSYALAYSDLRAISALNWDPFEPDWPRPNGFLVRAAFFEKIIPILEEIPVERFTKKGWTYFKELDRDW